VLLPIFFDIKILLRLWNIFIMSFVTVSSLNYFRFQSVSFIKIKYYTNFVLRVISFYVLI
jgi:hypothetical protein